MKKKPVFNWANPDKKFVAYELEPNEIFSENGICYKLDFENFNFSKIDEREKLFEKDIKRFLDAYGINISVDKYLDLYNLQSYIEMVWPEHDKNRSHKKEIFKSSRCSKDNPMLLSEAFDKKIATHLECSLLAQMYLQHCGIKSVLCRGNIFPEPNPDIKSGGYEHTYLMVHLNGRKYIYDPENPMLNSKGKPVIPRIMSGLKIPFKDRRAFDDLLNTSVAEGGGFAYLETSDIYGVGSRWLYGFESDDVENKVACRRTEAGIKRQAPDQPQQIYQFGGHGM